MAAVKTNKHQPVVHCTKVVVVAHTDMAAVRMGSLWLKAPTLRAVIIVLTMSMVVVRTVSLLLRDLIWRAVVVKVQGMAAA